MNEMPKHYRKAIQKLKLLENSQSYEAAFIFGSTARKQITKHSDLDVVIITSSKETCTQVNHPFIEGIKLDLSFINFTQLEQRNQEEIESAKRIPILAESTILFDKTGKLKKLRRTAKKSKPKVLGKKEHQWIQFMVYHATNKAKRYLESDPTSSLYSLHSNIGEILKFHYQINQRWWISDKRLVNDLREWDPKLARLLKSFITTSTPQTKFSFWEKICKHVLKPLGGLQEIAEINCNCTICQKHLKQLGSLTHTPTDLQKTS